MVTRDTAEPNVYPEWAAVQLGVYTRIAAVRSTLDALLIGEWRLDAQVVAQLARMLDRAASLAERGRAA